MVRYALKEGIKNMEGRKEGRKKEKLDTEKKKKYCKKLTGLLNCYI